MTQVMIGVGLDTARYGHHATLLNENLEQACPPFAFGESRQGYQKLQSKLEGLVQQHDGNVHFRFRLDAAGQYAANLRCFLEGLDVDKTISVGEPKRNKDYRSVHFPKLKSDAAESHACARFAIVERPSATASVPVEFLNLREVLSALESQTKRTTRLTNQLHNRLSRVFPELTTVVRSLATPAVLALLKRYPTAKKIAAARLSSLTAIPYLAKERAEKIQQAAEQSTACMHGVVVEKIVLELVGELDRSLNVEKKLEKLLETAFDALPVGNHVHVASIPGIGKLTAAALVASMISIDRFETPNALVNYFGVFPEEHSSGFNKYGKPLPPGTMRMSKKGNNLVRKLLYMASLAGITCNPAIKAVYARKMAENKPGAVSMGHCMRKLLHLVFAVWKTGEPFNPKHYPWGPPAEPTTLAGPQEKKAAGRKEQSSKRQAVTATTSSVEPETKKDKHSAANPAPLGGIDYAALRRQVSMRQVLSLLDFKPTARNGSQWRGPCPVHNPSSHRSKVFSVNVDKGVYRCHKCQSEGNQLDLWAAAKRLPIYDAAIALCLAIGCDPPRIQKGTEEKRHPYGSTG